MTVDSGRMPDLAPHLGLRTTLQEGHPTVILTLQMSHLRGRNARQSLAQGLSAIRAEPGPARG